MFGHPATPPKALAEKEFNTPSSCKDHSDTSWMNGIDTTGIDTHETLSGEDHAKDIIDFLQGLGLHGKEPNATPVQPSRVGTKTNAQTTAEHCSSSLTPAETRHELSLAFTVWAMQSPSVRKRNRLVFLCRARKFANQCYVSDRWTKWRALAQTQSKKVDGFIRCVCTNPGTSENAQTLNQQASRCTMETPQSGALCPRCRQHADTQASSKRPVGTERQMLSVFERKDPARRAVLRLPSVCVPV